MVERQKEMNLKKIRDNTRWMLTLMAFLPFKICMLVGFKYLNPISKMQLKQNVYYLLCTCYLVDM